MEEAIVTDKSSAKVFVGEVQPGATSVTELWGRQPLCEYRVQSLWIGNLRGKAMPPPRF